MDHRPLAASLPAAISLALAMQALPARAQQSCVLLPSDDRAKIQGASLKSG
jgi:hypothetical protein